MTSNSSKCATTNADHDSISCTVINALTSGFQGLLLKLLRGRAKEILAGVFHARPGEVEEMIQMRLEERGWDEQEVRQEDGLWPREFCLGV
jgi:hypothetical protein